MISDIASDQDERSIQMPSGHFKKASFSDPV
jgi:hypothetical protein